MATNLVLHCNNTAISFKDSELVKITRQIDGLATTIVKNQFTIAYNLGMVEKKGCYKKDGFKKSAEYAQKTFGLSKTDAYDFEAIGEHFMTEVIDIDEKGKKHITLEVALPKSERDWSMTALRILLSLDKDKKEAKRIALSLIENGNINSDMSMKELKDAVKAYKGIGKTEKEEDETEAEETETTETTEATEAKHIIELYDDGKCMIDGNEVGIDYLIATLENFREAHM